MLKENGLFGSRCVWQMSGSAQFVCHNTGMIALLNGI